MNRYVVMFVDSKWHSLNVDEFSFYDDDCNLSFTCEDIVVSFQTSDLVRDFKSRDIEILPNIIDLESFDKQMSQKGSDYRVFRNWKVIKMLKEHGVVGEEFKLEKNSFKVFLEHIANLFNELLKFDPEEEERFEVVEKEVNRIIFNRQMKGLSFSKECAKKKCIELEKEIYKIKNRLQLEFDIFMPESEKQQIEFLRGRNYSIIKSLEYSFNIRKNDNVICQLFYDLIRNQKDLDSFLFMLGHWGGETRIYPYFLGFGTITSRITLRQPSLQNLRKENRSVIVADPMKKLLYVDYSQFEAGILASLSDERKLIELYEDDIYGDLAHCVFNSNEKRSEAKIIFYRYMYGDKTLGKNEKAYFKRFSGLEKYKQNINKKLSASKKVGTTLGNYRSCYGDDCTWGLSHVIQATGSLIFKNALIRIHSEVRDAEFLIPMHDAALYQVSEFKYEESKEAIIEIFKEEFVRICPKIKPRVNCEDFYRDAILDDN